MTPVHVLILAAGEGKRMHSLLPKVLHPAAGLPLVVHVTRAAVELRPASLHVVVPRESAEVFRQQLRPYPATCVVQDPPAGTADAVAVGCKAIGETRGSLLVINGDCPGIRPSTLTALLERHGDAAATCLVVRPDEPAGYGRIVRDHQGNLHHIIEEADASEEELAIGEVNGGVYCFDLASLRNVLVSVGQDNVKGEYGLPDAFRLLRESVGHVGVFEHGDAEEVHGVNTRAELARAEALLHRRVLSALMEAGVTVRHPCSTFVDVDVTVGADTVLYPGIMLEGDSVIGAGCTLYPNVRVAASRIGDSVTLLDGSVIEDSTVGDGATIGPYARLRPGSDIGPRVRLGNFVETKATRIGAGSKAGHLSYLGDADIGDSVNVGAGTITCNYDGQRKYKTIIEDGAFIGSNTALVAPVRVGANAYVGAGSTITEDVPEDALSLARGRQTNKKGWASRRRASKKVDT
ncbi:MAG: bifunctional UDP-N-acetylglucosamine diphosphorylase/glucosamine-1-phosphate N-acetyltransferase GlmU [Acidobacteriota bacterium]